MRGPITAVRQAISDLNSGRPVVFTADPGADDPTGYLMLSAQNASASSLAFLVRFGAGFVCAAVTGETCARLALTPMAGTVTGPLGSYYTVSVDAEGGGTGISAADRARTLRLLADPEALETSFTRPGHVIPRRAHDDGVLGVPEVAECLVDLTRIAGLRTVGAYTALESPSTPTRVADVDECRTFAAMHELSCVTAHDVIAWRRQTEMHMQTTFAERRNETMGNIGVTGFRSTVTGADFVAYSIGRTDDAMEPLIHVHRETNFAPHLGSAYRALHAIAERMRVYGSGILIVERRANNLDESDNTAQQVVLASEQRDADVAQILRLMGADTTHAHCQLPPPRQSRASHRLKSQTIDQLGVVLK
ncbi:hypothetical protein CH298_26695 [Rhodococcoides fascians]|uniref:3,4-dihydroxy-2-butanone-4-phosphate synthase n=1 Tax=Rhodococcoides fascians TaxID=1828 RepID=UPI000B9A47AC|nr:MULTISPECIES: 3,4-dihydroxy-2-butanone-4-phosphate synthase [Rhodococcus]OZD68958.1 hypothetical protein CH263_08720 [Rhodococcus sp. 06-1059B-a]OZE81360.1 hypothetical protein CH303_27235 [Rhodococcus fascians]OZF10184.1 hypothetical protein CH298_26695 [Rhodococcus fascians]OZF13275.1 hypothetical protein CH297_26990 [Rhodococcus fascians]OZF59372.1 hypothetical protein CH308_27435 [Rhodococcus fascians]